MYRKAWIEIYAVNFPSASPRCAIDLKSNVTEKAGRLTSDIVKDISTLMRKSLSVFLASKTGVERSMVPGEFTSP